MNEILHELRDHSVGLNCGRLGSHFMRSYSELLIYTCHKRGVHVMGGMAVQIPIMDNPQENERAMELVKTDKRREVKAGHGGTWAAHPALIPPILEAFNPVMGDAPNQIQSVTRPEASAISDKDLLQLPRGVRTMDGLRLNTRVRIQYLAAWLTGSDAVPLIQLDGGCCRCRDQQGSELAVAQVQG